MAIDIKNDVFPPVAVATVNIVTRTSLPEWHDWFVYGMTAAGYLSDFFMRGPNAQMVKQIGVCSAPLAIDKIYERVRGGTVTSGARRVYAPVKRFPAAAYTPEFVNTARLD